MDQRERGLRGGWSLGLAVLLVVVFLAAGVWPWKEGGADFLGRRDPYWISEDFAAFYSAGTMVTAGVGAKLYDVHAVGRVEHAVAGQPVGGSGVLPYFNPPFFALVFAPLTQVSLARAYQLWTLTNLALLVLNCWLLWRIADALPRHWRVVLIAGYLTLYPVTYGIRLGQFSLLLQASWAAGYLGLRQRRERLAGAAFSVLLIKPELLVPLVGVLLWKRRFQVFTTLVPIVAASLAASVAVVGPAAALGYPDYLLDSAGGGAGVATGLMFNWAGLAAAVFGSASGVVLVAVGVCSLGTLAAVARAWRGAYRPWAGRFAWQWLALTLATLMVDPHLYLQDTVILVPAAVAALVATRGTARLAAGATLVGGWVALNAAGIAVALTLGGGLASAFGFPADLR